MRNASFLAALAPALAVAACYAIAPNGVPALRTDARSYGVDDTLLLILDNPTEERLITHPALCGAVLERRADGAWRWSEPWGPFVVCTAVAAVVEPGDSLVALRVLDDVDTGTFRFRAQVTLERSRERPVLETQPFQVR